MPREQLMAKVSSIMEEKGYHIRYISPEDGEIEAERFADGQKEQWSIEMEGSTLLVLARVRGNYFQILGGPIGAGRSVATAYDDTTGAKQTWYTEMMGSLRSICATSGASGSKPSR